MNSLILSRPLLGFVVGTRAALAFGVGLLLARSHPGIAPPRHCAVADWVRRRDDYSRPESGVGQEPRGFSALAIVV